MSYIRKLSNGKYHAEISKNYTSIQSKTFMTQAKYQVMLDKELYKAIKVLRETQSWRLETLESVTEKNGFVLENEG